MYTRMHAYMYTHIHVYMSTLSVAMLADKRLPTRYKEALRLGGATSRNGLAPARQC